MFDASITSLIATPDGAILPSFACKSPDDWAKEQMLARYHQILTDADGPGSFIRLCYDRLKEERTALSSWFDSEGKLQLSLRSIFMMNRLAGPIDDGIGWDFRNDGAPEQRMLVFKGTLMAVCRATSLIPVTDRDGGNMQFGGLATLVKSAYTERARLHLWRGYDAGNDARKYSGSEMSQRWVAHQSYVFLLGLEAPSRWAWEVSGCIRQFGPVDERKSLY
jgi:hypothetical protein